MPAVAAARAPGPVTLVATGCGTAIACVCALGLGEIERRLGGIWSVLAVVCAALLCAALARALGRLTTVVPSGAGLLAFLSRGLGRRWALVLMLPYVALVLALVAVEARIVGAVSARLLPIPPAVGRARLPSVHLGRRPQRRPSRPARAGGRDGRAGDRVLAARGGRAWSRRRGGPTSSPTSCRRRPRRWRCSVGSARRCSCSWASSWSPTRWRWCAPRRDRLGAGAQRPAAHRLLCAGGARLLDAAPAPQTGVAPGSDGDWLTPQLGLGAAAASPIGAAAIGILCLLASFTSFNGALLTLSRLVAALASQGVLPRRLAHMDARRMVPSHALAALLAAVVALTFLLSTHALINAVLAGSAAAAGLVWAAAIAVRERAPFAEPGRPRRHRVAALALASLFVVFGLGALAEGLKASAAPARVEIAHAH